MNQTAIITGGTGFIGSHLVDFLLEKKWNVFCIVRPNSNLQWLKEKPVTLVETDLSNTDALTPIFANCDYVFHLAGVLFARSEKDFLKGNLEYTARLLKIIIASNTKLKRFLFLGTLASVGPSPNGDLLDETTPLNPLTWYGISKAETEKLILSYNDRLPITIVRAPVVYGPRDYALFELFKASKAGFNLIPGHKNKFISIIYIQDLIKGLYKVVISENTINQIYFLSANDIYPQYRLGEIIIRKMGKNPKNILIPWTIMQFAAMVSELIGKLLNKKVILNRQKLIEIKQNYWVCDNAKAKRDFGFESEWTLEEGIEETLKWYKDNRWL